MGSHLHVPQLWGKPQESEASRFRQPCKSVEPQKRFLFGQQRARWKTDNGTQHKFDDFGGKNKKYSAKRTNENPSEETRECVTEDKDAEVRVAAADALGMIGPPDTSIPILVKTLRGDSSPSVRMCAVFALSKFPSYPNVVEEVQRVAQQDESAKVRECADSALRRLKDSDRSGECWNLLGPK